MTGIAVFLDTCLDDGFWNVPLALISFALGGITPIYTLSQVD